MGVDEFVHLDHVVGRILEAEIARSDRLAGRFERASTVLSAACAAAQAHDIDQRIIARLSAAIDTCEQQCGALVEDAQNWRAYREVARSKGTASWIDILTELLPVLERKFR